MLCEPEYEDDVLTGIGPARVEFRCIPACCPRTVKLQIRSRYKTGFAKLCGDYVDPEASPPEDSADIEYHTTGIFTNQYTKWQISTPSDNNLGTCTQTITNVAGEVAIVSHDTTLPDCNGEPSEEVWSPENCNETLTDPPTDYTTRDPSFAVSGDVATPNDVRDQAITTMGAQEWSEWSDLLEIEPYAGTAEAGYLEHELSFSSLSDNGIAGLGFIASSTVLESELRVWGALPIHISTTRGDTITKTVLTPGSSVSFVVDDPQNNDTWQPENITLRCACPVQFAPS